MKISLYLLEESPYVLRVTANQNQNQNAMNPHTAYVLKHGRPVFDVDDGDPENGPGGITYLGHRLGQVVAFTHYPEDEPVRANAMFPKGAPRF